MSDVTQTETSSQVRAAALNNVAWCDLVCQAHEVRTITSKQFWVALQNTPPEYPDAVTLAEKVSPESILKLIQNQPGASVKDSFADLDLRGHGYQVLFTADWIYRPAAEGTAGTPSGWSVVGSAEDLREWSTASGLGHLMHEALLDHPDIRILRGTDPEGNVVGAILSRTDSVVGISNVFTTGTDGDAVWAGVIQAATACFPGLALCGYEWGESRDEALKAGFATIGPLRIWMRP